MKTRTSLVSNSSSSSFICRRPIGEVALDMWQIVTEDYGTRYNGESVRRAIKKLCNRKDVQTGERGICFPSTNYETYILASNGLCFIETSNTHRFEDINGMCGQGEDSSYELMRSKSFYHAHAKNLLLKHETANIPENSDVNLVCPKCKKRWGHQGSEEMFHNDYHYIDEQGNRYCTDHCCKLIEKKKVTENETP